MSGFRHRSFLCGVVLASLTWAASFYLYVSLSSSERNVTVTDVVRINEEEPYTPLREKLRQFKTHNFFNFKTGKKFEDPFLNDKNELGYGGGEPSWKEKFKKLIHDKDFYENSDKLVNGLHGKVKALGPLLGSSKDNAAGLIRTLEEKKIREEGYKKHAFNALISERIGFDRDVPDTRHARCNDLKYPKNLQSASVIICFYNEEFNVLIRTVHSVLKRSNPNHLHEIVLVDDFSDLDNIHDRVWNYIKKNLPAKVTLLKTPKREGLIRARVFGARHATGDVLVFLDSHVEPNINWLDPLLSRIAENKSTIATPIIDIINADTFHYTPSPLVKGGFNWGLHFRWDNVPRSQLKTEADFIQPIVSPTMAGGLFAIDKEYFHHLGEYDEGMNVWGGENVELSFRVWMCGGRLEIIPCSRVGHVFRRRRPYGSEDGDDTVVTNSIRVAEVWMDEYKEKFYETQTQARGKSFGNINSRVSLRKDLGCKSFKWYLQNVYPEMLENDNPVNKVGNLRPWNTRSRNYVNRFLIRITGTVLCLSSEKDAGLKNSGVVLSKCMTLNTKKQRWSETDKHELVLAEMLCLDASSDYPKIAKCHEMLGTQEWSRVSDEASPIYNLAAGLCLGVDGSPEVGSSVKMKICDEKDGIKFDFLSTSS